MCTISRNEQFNSFELQFDCKPAESVRDLLKANGYRWHSVKRIWYGYKDIAELLNGATVKQPTTATTANKPEKSNMYGVKVGDLFVMSWGYDQTNIDIFQVIELVGNKSVRLREVKPPIVSEKGISSMSRDVKFKADTTALYPEALTIFIKDQERGDLKQIQKDPYSGCLYIKIGNHHARPYHGEKLYESWYA